MSSYQPVSALCYSSTVLCISVKPCMPEGSWFLESHLSVICDVMVHTLGHLPIDRLFFLIQTSLSELKCLAFKDHVWPIFCWRGQAAMTFEWSRCWECCFLQCSYLCFTESSGLEILPFGLSRKSLESINYSCPYIVIVQSDNVTINLVLTLVTGWETLVTCHILTLNLLLSRNAPVYRFSILCAVSCS